MGYKSTRLLVEAIHDQMSNMKKLLMTELATSAIDGAQDSWIELRKLIDELAEKTNVQTVDGLPNLSPGDYVRTMKPLVEKYHRQLMVADKLQACLCADLQATGCVLILIGDGKTIIRTAYDETRPEAAMGVEAVLQALEGMNQTLQQGVEEYQNQAGVEAPRRSANDELQEEDVRAPLRVRYADQIQRDDFERNARAELVIDWEGVVVKDRNGPAGRKATQEEIDSCVLVKDAGDDEMEET